MRLARERSAISAAIGALLMIAVAVVLSVALFLSATGYLSSLVSSGSSLQPGQNQAARDLLSIENAQAKACSQGLPNDCYVVLYARNVGGSSITLGSLTLTAPPTNAGQTRSFSSVLNAQTKTWSTAYSDSNEVVYVCDELVNQTVPTCNGATSVPTLSTVCQQPLPCQQIVEVWIEWVNNSGGPWSLNHSPHPVTGDAFQVQISSTVGTSTIVTVAVP